MGGCHVIHSSHKSTYVLCISFLFIQSIPKRINNIMNYLDFHLDYSILILDYLYSAFYDTIAAKQLHRKLSF